MTTATETLLRKTVQRAMTTSETASEMTDDLIRAYRLSGEKERFELYCALVVELSACVLVHRAIMGAER